jgi:hypothetical protein
VRLRNGVTAAMAAMSLLALAPAGASALKHPNLTGNCNVNINAVPHLLEAGETVSVFGHLSCFSRANAAGRTVTLMKRTIGTPGFTAVATASTDGRGFYELTTPGVLYNSVFYVRSHGAASGRRTVRVFAHVGVTGPTDGSQLLTGAANKVTFSGSVSPADVGALVVLQRQNAVTGNAWHRIQLGSVGPGGSYSIIHTFVVPGDANIRVLVRSEGRNVPSPSDVLNYEISQAQNQQLTINPSADPITYEQSVTISGVVAGAAVNTPVTLFAHTAHQVGFAPVTEVKTDGVGGYTFPAQSPVNSTFYQVRAGGKDSAVLYEGVKDLLFAVAPQSTIPAGQPLKFTGTVGPDHSGHVIYLEQQNHAGSGFHIVQVETVGPGSAYSIVHTVYDTGSVVFRVKIPGGPENEGSASGPFTVNVTAVPAELLSPEASSNATLPSEGEV